MSDFEPDSKAVHNGEPVVVLYVTKRNALGEPERYMVRYLVKKKHRKNRVASVCSKSLSKPHD